MSDEWNGVSMAREDFETLSYSPAAHSHDLASQTSRSPVRLITLLAAAIALGISACTSEETSTGPSTATRPELAIVGTYTAVDLGTLGGLNSHATAINPEGRVVGYSDLSNGEQHAFLWDKGRLTDLGTLGGKSSRATAINPAGDVVGISSTAAGGPDHAFLWKNGQLRDLGTLGGSNKSEPRGINPRGELVGVTLVAAPNVPGGLLPHAFVWENGVLRDLGYGVAYAINPKGDVVGEGGSRNGATLWDKTGVATDLGDLGEDGSSARAINPAGQVVGYTSLPPPPEEPVFTTIHAFLWEHGVMRDLGALDCGAGRCNSLATGINPSGQVVGSSEAEFEHAFLWENGVMTDLGTLGGFTSRASAINPNGQVVGGSQILSPHGGECCADHATLWTRK